MSRTTSGTERVAPEVQAARALFSPDNQRQIERLADDLELILGGDASEPSSRLSPEAAARRRSRRAFSLWVGVPVVLLFVLVAAVFGGWASALQYHNVAENEHKWAQDAEDNAERERALRLELQMRRDELREILARQSEVLIRLKESDDYATATALIELVTPFIDDVEDENPALAAQFAAVRRDIIIGIVDDLYDQPIDLELLRRALLAAEEDGATDE